MTKITRIPASAPAARGRLKVAAYARVSMDSDAMSHSLSTQVSYYSAFIQKNPAWEYVGVYADYGISGTGTKKRSEFNRMVADAEQGLIDIILTKSISRFARNTVDLLQTVRRLKDIGVEVRFERENISSLSGEGELMLSILASFAQEESRSISQNMKWAIRKKFEQGIPNNHIAPYGYVWDGEIYRLQPERAEIVKRIFSEYLAGKSAHAVAKGLAADGVTNRSGTLMTDATVKEILDNPSYTGTAVLQKYYFTDAKKKRTNKGELARYAVEGLYEPIITNEDFETAQEIRHQRAAYVQTEEPTPFSGKMRCGTCGCGVSRRTAGGKKKWACNTRERKGVAVCGMRPVMEDELLQAWTEIGQAPFTLITVYDDRIAFSCENGKSREVFRSYGGYKKRNGFSGRLVCGCCGATLMRRTRHLKNGSKVVWGCPKTRDVCAFGSIDEDTVRLAVRETIGSRDYEARFVALFKRADCFTDRIEFHYKEGGTVIWQR